MPASPDVLPGPALARVVVARPGTVADPVAAWLVPLAAFHLVLGLVAGVVPGVAVAHAAVVATSLGLVVLGRSAATLACAIVYTTGCEVFWRMRTPAVPWDLAKYLAIALAIGLAWRLRRAPRGAGVPLLYLVALLPAVLVLLANDVESDRRVVELLRFNLLGPALLASASIAFAPLVLTRAARRAVLAAALLPACAIAGVVALHVRAMQGTPFGTESNAAVTGGFGPNQVSGALSLGIVAAFLLALDDRAARRLRVIATGACVVLAAACALTFSRGGIYSAAVALVAGGGVLARAPRYRRALGGFAVAVAVLGGAVIVPRLGDLTGGAIFARFAEAGTTNRDVLMLDDLRLFLEHPLLGVGPGLAGEHRTLLAYGMGHTEYTRMLAEHGIGGLVALVALLVLGLRAVVRRGSPWVRATRLAFAAWAGATMLHLAMRIADIGLGVALGQLGALAAAGGEDDEEPTHDGG